MMMAIFSGRNM